MRKINKELFENISLLYVEDDLMTSQEVTFFLKKYIKNLYVAKNGEEGLELFKKHKPDMIITDVQMPVMNGLAMSEEILKISPTTPIALTTAFSESRYILKAIELGIDKYILKPINIKEVLIIIQKALNLEIKKHLDNYDEYLNFILNTNPTFMFITHSEKIEYINNDFLDFLGYTNKTELQEELNKCQDIFEIKGLEESNTNWIEYLKNSPQKEHQINFKDKNLKQKFNREFVVTYKYFKNMNKSVFVFNDKNELKLDKINLLATQLLEKNRDNKELSFYLEEIINTSNKIDYYE
ncbi:response regulator transcription factor [Arcobacter sp. YIC-464]|uniref:response regulator transcription factor n=1 Tax=Arcobacter sp. YIC-464 TaxID=3376631 RepID=UPI003C1F1F09